MKLTEATALNSADFPIAELKAYLRLGSGFTDDNVQDGLLETCLRAAMGAIEARTTKVLVARSFKLSFSSYREEGGGLLLPLSPVTNLSQFLVYDRTGVSTSYSKNDFQLVDDSQRPVLQPKSGNLPKIPEDGWVLLRFVAGYGVWADVPNNLQQAMLMLAATYYENRDVMVNGGGQMPLAVAGLLVPFQRIRLRSGA